MRLSRDLPSGARQKRRTAYWPRSREAETRSRLVRDAVRYHRRDSPYGRSYEWLVKAMRVVPREFAAFVSQEDPDEMKAFLFKQEKRYRCRRRNAYGPHK